MKVTCVSRRPTPEQVRRLGFDPSLGRDFNITAGKAYLVLGINFVIHSRFLGTGAILEIIDDFDRWAMAPLCLFEIVDPRPSSHWVASKAKDDALLLLPESFHQPFYHDQLTDGVPQVVADFKRVKALLESEFDSEVQP